MIGGCLRPASMLARYGALMPAWAAQASWRMPSACLSALTAAPFVALWDTRLA